MRPRASRAGISWNTWEMEAYSPPPQFPPPPLPPSLRSHRLPRTSARGGACTEAEAWTARGGRRGQRGHSACSPSAKAGVNLSNTDKKGIGHKSTDVRQESTKPAIRGKAAKNMRGILTCHPPPSPVLCRSQGTSHP